MCVCARRGLWASRVGGLGAFVVLLDILGSWGVTSNTSALTLATPEISERHGHVQVEMESSTLRLHTVIVKESLKSIINSLLIGSALEANISGTSIPPLRTKNSMFDFLLGFT